MCIVKGVFLLLLVILIPTPLFTVVLWSIATSVSMLTPNYESRPIIFLFDPQVTEGCRISKKGAGNKGVGLCILIVERRKGKREENRGCRRSEWSTLFYRGGNRRFGVGWGVLPTTFVERWIANCCGLICCVFFVMFCSFVFVLPTFLPRRTFRYQHRHELPSLDARFGRVAAAVFFFSSFFFFSFSLALDSVMTVGTIL